MRIVLWKKLKAIPNLRYWPLPNPTNFVAPKKMVRTLVTRFGVFER